MKRIKIIAIILLLTLSISLVFMACDKKNEIDPNTVYTIQYTDESGLHTIEVKNGDLYSIEVLPSKTGYKFIGLYDAEVGGTQYVNSQGSAVSAFTDNKNIVLYPQFAANEYTLVLDYQGAAVTGERQMAVSYGSKLTNLPTNLTMENKDFMGWYTQPNRKGIQVADQYGMIPGNDIINETIYDISQEKGLIYLYAGFRGVLYDLTFYFGDGIEPETMKIEHGTSIDDVRPKTRVDGKGVYKWSLRENDTALANVYSGEITGPMVLYAAQFAPVIDFVTNGGEEVLSIIKPSGASIVLPKAERENYIFVNWESSTGSTITITKMPSTSTTLYAVWQAQIIFDENGGSSVDDIACAAGETISLPTPEKEGFLFAGWYTSDKKLYEKTTMPSESVKVKAGWYKSKTLGKVIMSADNYVKCSGNTSTFTDKLTIDFSEILPSNFNNIVKLKIKWKAKHEWASQGDTAKVVVEFYSKRTVSDIYFLGRTISTHDSTSYISVSKDMTIKMESNMIYVAIACDVRGNYLLGTRYYGIISDLNVVIEYPDTANLYL